MDEGFPGWGAGCLPGAVDVRAAQARLAELASLQHGIIGTRQLPPLGISHQDVQQLVRRGSVVQVGPQAFRMAGVPDTWLTALSIGVQSLDDRAVVSHRAAARLHGFDRFRHDPPEFTVRRRRRGAFVVDAPVHTTLVLPELDRTVVAGLPVTSAIRTIIDLAAVRVGTQRLEAAVDSTLRLGLATLDEIAARLHQLRGRGRRGVRRLDQVLLTSGGESFLERRFLELIDTAGLPRPIPQAEHRVDGVHIARVDFLYPDAGIVIEVSGGRGHSTAADRAKDARRRNELQRLGRLVLEFTYEDVTGRPPYVVQSLRESLCSCRAH